MDANDLRGQVLFGCLHPEDAAQFYQTWNAARFVKGRFEVEARIHAANGTYRWFLIRSNPQLPATGDVKCWYGVHIDVEDQ